MECSVCGKEMVNTIGGCHHCDNCGFAINDLVFRPRVGTGATTGQATGNDNPFIQQGWQCPKCGAILAPHQDYCPFCKGGGTTGTVLKTVTTPAYVDRCEITPLDTGTFTISTSSDTKVTGTLKAED